MNDISSLPPLPRKKVTFEEQFTQAVEDAPPGEEAETGDQLLALRDGQVTQVHVDPAGQEVEFGSSPEFIKTHDRQLHFYTGVQGRVAISLVIDDDDTIYVINRDNSDNPTYYINKTPIMGLEDNESIDSTSAVRHILYAVVKKVEVDPLTNENLYSFCIRGFDLATGEPVQLLDTADISLTSLVPAPGIVDPGIVAKFLITAGAPDTFSIYTTLASTTSGTITEDTFLPGTDLQLVGFSFSSRRLFLRKSAGSPVVFWQWLLSEEGDDPGRWVGKHIYIETSRGFTSFEIEPRLIISSSLFDAVITIPGDFAELLDAIEEGQDFVLAVADANSLVEATTRVDFTPLPLETNSTEENFHWALAAIVNEIYIGKFGLTTAHDNIVYGPLVPDSSGQLKDNAGDLLPLGTGHVVTDGEIVFSIAVDAGRIYLTEKDGTFHVLHKDSFEELTEENGVFNRIAMEDDIIDVIVGHSVEVTLERSPDLVSRNVLHIYEVRQVEIVITLAHKGFDDDFMPAYPPQLRSGSDIYGMNDPRRFTNRLRKFVLGRIILSSIIGDTRPHEFILHTGQRGSADIHEGETAGSDLLEGTVFSLDGIFQIFFGVKSNRNNLAPIFYLMKVNPEGRDLLVDTVGNSSILRTSQPRGEFVETNESGFGEAGVSFLSFRYNQYLPADRYYILWRPDARRASTAAGANDPEIEEYFSVFAQFSRIG